MIISAPFDIRSVFSDKGLVKILRYFRMSKFIKFPQLLFVTHIVPAAFGPIVDTSEDVALVFILYMQEPVGRMFIRYWTMRCGNNVV